MIWPLLQEELTVASSRYCDRLLRRNHLERK